MFITAGLGVYVWWSNREKVTAGKFARLEGTVSARVTKEELKSLEDEHKDRLDRHRREMVEMKDRIIKMESDICHLPSQVDMKALGDRISDLHGSLKEFSGRLSGINRVVDLFNEFLINQGSKGQPVS